MIMFSGCSKNIINNSNQKQNETKEQEDVTKELITIEGIFTIEQKTRYGGMVNGIRISGYDCEEIHDWCKPPKCQTNRKGCPYVNKTVKITGYLGQEDCIGESQCLRTGEMKVNSITIINQTSNWQIHHNEALKYEFRYPGVLLDPQEIKADTYGNFIFYSLKDDDSQLIIGFINQEELDNLGTMSCWSKPELFDCETVKSINTDATIQWTKFVGTDIPIAHAWIKHLNGGVITLNYHSIDNEKKIIFREMLSTFKFTE